MGPLGGVILFHFCVLRQRFYGFFGVDKPVALRETGRVSTMKKAGPYSVLLKTE